MEFFYTIFSVVQSLAISLGVGCSTVAVAYYLTAKQDGPADPARRHDTRPVYTLLRAAMGLILLSTAGLALVFFLGTGGLLLSTYSLAIWTFIAVLFLNAILMTLHRMPRVIGSGLQGGTWYALGITVAVPAQIILNMSYVEFFLWYVGFVGAVIVFIHLVIAHQKEDL